MGEREGRNSFERGWTGCGGEGQREREEGRRERCEETQIGKRGNQEDRGSQEAAEIDAQRQRQKQRQSGETGGRRGREQERRTVSCKTHSGVLGISQGS